LDETLWEEGPNSYSEQTKETESTAIKINSEANQNQNDDNNNSNNNKIADGGLDASSKHQTIDGVFPTFCYKNLELRKTHVGQREYEIVDTTTKEILYRTIAVPGTLAWFDVLKPTVCGKPLSSDYLLRVRALDHLRRTWIVYRYNQPVFEGQAPVGKESGAYKGHVVVDDDGDDDVDGDDDTILLYKTACLAVSWSRYVVIAARYGMPEPEDWKIQNQVDEFNNGNDDDNDEEQQQKQQKQKQQKTDPPINNEVKENDLSNNDDDNEIITPKEMMKLQQRESPGYGIEESKSDETDTGNGEGNNDNAVGKDNKQDHGLSSESKSRSFESSDPTISSSSQHSSTEHNVEQSLRSRAQTNKLRSYFGDTPSQRMGGDATKSVTTKLATKSSSLLQSGKQRISSSFSSLRKSISRDDSTIQNEETETIQQEDQILKEAKVTHHSKSCTTETDNFATTDTMAESENQRQRQRQRQQQQQQFVGIVFWLHQGQGTTSMGL